MTADDIRSWAARCAERGRDGFSVGPGQPAQLIVQALDLLAEREAGEAAAVERKARRARVIRPERDPFGTPSARG